MNSLKFVLFSFLACSFLLTSCLTDQCNETRQFIQYDPVYMTADEFRIETVSVESQRNVDNLGKMYYYKDMLFLNEQGLGIHIYDNTNPENPTYIAFYNIPGNFDIAIKDDLLIADNVIDMITIDISNIMNPVITSRIEDYNERFTYWEDNPDYRYIAYSVPSEVTQSLDCSDANFNNNRFWRGDVLWLEATVDFDANILSNTTSTGSGSSTGTGGSTARFTISDSYLYTVDFNSLSTYSIHADYVSKESDKNLGWGIETIFPYKDNLFIGSESGMFIYSLENPTSPYRLSSFEHARACDPVVANDTHAFVTLRDGNLCQGFINQLDVIDITSLTSPKLVKSYPMVNPHGLSLNGDFLYISEGNFGLKVLDIDNPSNVKELSFDERIASTDVIYLGNNHLLSIGKDGLSQYDVTDPDEMKLISLITVD